MEKCIQIGKIPTVCECNENSIQLEFGLNFIQLNLVGSILNIYRYIIQMGMH